MKSNKVIFSHALSVVNKSYGDLIVVTVGDDISEPNRVTLLLEAWEQTRSWALISRFTRINEAGKIWEENRISEMRENEIREYFPNGPYMALIYDTATAYHKRAFELSHHMHEGVMNEDGVMNFYCIIMANASA